VHQVGLYNEFMLEAVYCLHEKLIYLQVIVYFNYTGGRRQLILLTEGVVIQNLLEVEPEETVILLAQILPQAEVLVGVDLTDGNGEDALGSVPEDVFHLSGEQTFELVLALVCRIKKREARGPAGAQLDRADLAQPQLELLQLLLVLATLATCHVHDEDLRDPCKVGLGIDEGLQLAQHLEGLIDVLTELEVAHA